eukprot:2152927-Amphidinium_carterae.1
MRDVSAMYAAIGSGSFAPDATRSGYMTPVVVPPTPSAAPAFEGVDVEVEESDTDTVVPTASDCSVADQEEDDEVE